MPLSDATDRSRKPVRWRAEPMLEASARSSAFRPIWTGPGSEAGFEPDVHVDVGTIQASALSTDAATLLQPSPDALAAPDEPAIDPDPLIQAVDAVPAVPVPAVVPVFEPAPPPPPLIDARQLAAEREAGVAEGRAAAIAEMQAALEEQRERIVQIGQGLHAAMLDTQRFYRPLERLALHLARQLVRGELTLSGQAIGRLVEQSLRELDTRSSAIVVHLNPGDLEQLEALNPGFDAAISLARDPGLSPGSVRVQMDEGLVEDLIEHRLDTLSRTLLGEPWTRPVLLEAGADPTPAHEVGDAE